MNKEFLLEFKIELQNQIIPLPIHYAILKNRLEDLSDNNKIDGNLPLCAERYKTIGYIPGNKFYKPISRTLNV